ncbi:12001_t:CDS:2, partial [Diversispora eburnea]
EQNKQNINTNLITVKDIENVLLEVLNIAIRELCEKLEKLYKLYYELSQEEEKDEISEIDASEIIKGLLKMSIK